MHAFFPRWRAVTPAADVRLIGAALLLALALPAWSQEEAGPADDEGAAAETGQEGAEAGADETAPVEAKPVEPVKAVKPVEPVEPVKPPPPPVPVRPTAPAKADGHKALVRPALWLAWSRSRFRKRNSITEPGNTLELEDDGTFDARSVHLLLPVEGLIHGENKQFRFRYLWWNAEGSATMPLGWKFGSIDLLAPQSVKAALDTDILGADILFRISEYRYFDLFLTTGADIFMTHLKVDAGSGGVDDIEETIPILTVGLGLRFNIGDDVSVFLSNSALSYSQLLGIKDAFFDVKDTYRNLELSVRWEFDLYPKLTLGAGWRHYEVGFENTELLASQRMKGVVGWLRYDF